MRERIARAGGTGVRLVAVTKTWGPEAVLAAAAAGCDAIGENYAQETVAKWAELSVLIGAEGVAALPELHFIGRGKLSGITKAHGGEAMLDALSGQIP